MHDSLHTPMADQATRIFVDRCDELGLWVWGLSDNQLKLYPQTFSAPADAASLTDVLANRLDDLRKSMVPCNIDNGVMAVVIPDPEGMMGQSFVLVPASGGELDCCNLQQLGATARALAWSLTDLRRAEQNQFAVEDLTNQLGQCYENITLLYGIGRSMRTPQTPQLIARGICEQICITQGYGWSAVRFIEDGEEVSGLSDACLITGDMPCSEESFADQTATVLTQWDEDNWSKLLQIGQHPLADLVESEIILEPIHHDGQAIGLVLAGGKTGPNAEATSGDTQLLDAIAGFLGALHENATRFIEQKNMFIGSLKAVSTALDAKDRYTHGHSERVAWLGAQLAEAIGLDSEEVERIRISGLVHDVGKIGVPEAVLCKTGRLTDEEFEQIKKHPRIGYNILKDIPKMADVLDGVLYHHERWDGRGYPARLAGEGIPLYGRILAVADTFDAMSSTRSYRKAMPRDKALEEITACSGSQFDPSLTGPFVALDFSEYDEMVARHQDTTTISQTDLAA